MLRRLSFVLAATGLLSGVLLATGAVALAAPVTPAFTITADRASAVPAGHRWSFNDFFPRTATIASGSSFQFTNEGFHTATLLPNNWSVAADLDVNGIVSADIDDRDLNPNGTTKALENIAPALPVPAQGCGTADTPCDFDGTSIVSMGAPLAGPPAPFVVKVTAPPGTYAFHCRIHPKMVGSLTVVAAGAAGTTTSASADAAAATQATADVAAGMAAEASASTAKKVTNASGRTTWTLTAGTSDPAGHVAVLDMLPRKITIKSGDSVVWRPLDRGEPHTVTFASNGTIQAANPMCEGPGGKDTPAVPTVVPPTSPLDFACGAGPVDEFEFDGGNGVTTITSPTTVADSGVLAYRTEAASFDVPATAALSSWRVSFAGASKGTYAYACLIHEGMNGTIVVH
jgi:plastocyanin